MPAWHVDRWQDGAGSVQRSPHASTNRSANAGTNRTAYSTADGCTDVFSHAHADGGTNTFANGDAVAIPNARPEHAPDGRADQGSNCSTYRTAHFNAHRKSDGGLPTRHVQA